MANLILNVSVQVLDTVRDILQRGGRPDPGVLNSLTAGIEEAHSRGGEPTPREMAAFDVLIEQLEAVEEPANEPAPLPAAEAPTPLPAATPDEPVAQPPQDDAATQLLGGDSPPATSGEPELPTGDQTNA
jgi:hypothetical protein